MAISKEASVLAYQIGLANIAPLVQRVLDLEAQVAAITERLDAVESAQRKSVPLHLKNMEVR